MWHRDALPSHNVGLMNTRAPSPGNKNSQINSSVFIGHRKKRSRNSLQPWNKQMYQHKKQIKPTSDATVVADGSNVCCSSLTLPPCKHAGDRQRWFPAIFSTICGQCGKVMGASAVLIQPWISHPCRLLTAIYHFLITQPSPELQLHPSFTPAVLGAEPFWPLVMGCCGSNAFFSHCLWVKKATVGCF